MSEIKAIPTTYKGVEYRSRMEAQCAVLLDKLGWEFEYEAHSIILPSGLTFIPDFWIPRWHRFVECRGYESERGNRQLDEFGSILQRHGVYEVTSGVVATEFIAIGPHGGARRSHEQYQPFLVVYLEHTGWWKTQPTGVVLAAFAIDVAAGKIYINGQPLDEADLFHEFCERSVVARERTEQILARMLAGGSENA